MNRKNPVPRESYTLVPIASDEDWRAIEVFKKRAKEFISIRDRQSPGIIQANMTRLDDGRFSGSSNIPGDEKLKELYLAFRFFYLEKEPSSFLRVRNIISKHCASTEAVLSYLRSLKEGWNRAMSETSSAEFYGRRISGRDYVDMWFNAYYFHSDQKTEQRLEDVNTFLSEDISRFHLYLTIVSAGACIGLLYLAIRDLTRSDLAISVPTSYAGKAKDS